MSKVSYTVDVNEYVCTALEYIRKMHETRDYSSLMATVERIQFHANNMESSIGAAFTSKNRMCGLIYQLDEGKLTNEEFIVKVREAMKPHTDKAVENDYDYCY